MRARARACVCACVCGWVGESVGVRGISLDFVSVHAYTIHLGSSSFFFFFLIILITDAFKYVHFYQIF